MPSSDEGLVYLKTTIRDSGIGMSEDFLPHLFEEFSREHSSTETKVEGTGLGMPIVKQLVGILGGSIDVISKKGVGTTVEVILPHRIADKDDCYEKIDRSVDTSLFNGKKILLAEDNELNAEIAMEILKESGFIIEHVWNGIEAVEAVRKNDYDLVLMDIQMPKMNGYEATVAIRKLNDKQKAAVPIVAMTANAFEEDKREAYRSGMDGHIAKPINVKDILVQLSKILRKSI
ncbi:MAG: response regulator [Erysipelotrichaceae bacterium]|nr:response regulator [Erysipelotrichaceae bacterium]